VPPELLATKVKDFAEAFVAAVCVTCFIVFCSYIIIWAYP